LLFKKEEFGELAENNTIRKNYDKVGSIRKLYSNLLKVKAKDHEDDDKITPLIFYGRKPQSQSVEFNSTCEFKKFNPDSKNMLMQRRSLSNFSDLDVMNLKRDLSSDGVNISLKSLKKAFLSPPETIYPKTYLPSPGFGFLLDPFPQKSKKKKK
jgi:glycerol-3-phosphate O-acyltransferase